MIKAIMKEIGIDAGSLEIGHNAQIGYFAQNQASLLNENATILKPSMILRSATSELKDILGAFMFHGDDVTKSKSQEERKHV
jgi:ATP-binding cassette subfamily F protein 3